MAAIGLVTDGAYDRLAITALVRACRPGVGVESRQCPRDSTQKAIRILKELARPGMVSFAVWVRDAETIEPEKVQRLEKSMSDAVRSADGLMLDVRCVMAVPMLEAWLLADEDAVQKICGASRLFQNPERIEDPKSELRRLLNQRPYTREVARHIAEIADVNLVAKRCPSFQKLRDALH